MTGGVRISPPENVPPLFRTGLSVRIGDLNYGNHLGNDRILSFCHEARVRYLTALGFSELDFLGDGLIMRDASAVYKGQGFFGNRLDIDLWAGDFWPYGFSFTYLLVRQKDQGEIARAKTGMVFFDYTEQIKVKKGAEVEKALQPILSPTGPGE